MKAGAVFPSTRRVDVVELAEPKITSPNEVKLRMLEIGICGTDREICNFDYGTPPDGSEFLVLGHEALGEVVEVSSSTSQFKLGDLVVPSVRRPCPHHSCSLCRSDLQDCRFRGDFTSDGI